MREERTILDGPITALALVLFLLVFYGLFPKVAEVARPLDELPMIISSVVQSTGSLLPSQPAPRSRGSMPSELQSLAFGENIAFIPTRLGQRTTPRAILRDVSQLLKGADFAALAADAAFMAGAVNCSPLLSIETTHIRE
jgi:hypothetical protein